MLGTPRPSELPRARGHLSARVDRVLKIEETPPYHPCTKYSILANFPRLKRKLNLKSTSFFFSLSLSLARVFGAPLSHTWRPARGPRRGPRRGLRPRPERLAQPRGVRGDPDANPEDDRVPQRVQPVYEAPSRDHPEARLPLQRSLAFVEAALGVDAGDRRPVLEKMTFDPSSPPPRLWFWDRHRAQAFSTHVGTRGVVAAGEGELRSSGHGRQHA